MRYQINSNTPIDFGICESNEAKSVLRNIYLILNTVKGTVPMYRDFGLSMSFKDRPITVVQPLIVSDVKQAIEKFEPRAKIASIKFSVDAEQKITIMVEVEL